jgi:spore germination cell wall hydrolase CwlJ-like protein
VEGRLGAAGEAMIRLTDIGILARTIMGEARGEPFDGKVAVGRTIVNRWRSKKWFAGATIAETAQMTWQYSCWNRNDPNRARILDAAFDEAGLRECMRAALDAIDGKGAEWLKDCTHYYADHIRTPNWAEGRTPAGQIGNHIFFAKID